MALYRRPILDPGFYYYDAPEMQTPGFREWLKTNSSLLKVRKTTEFPDHLFVLFEVIFPALWLDAKQFGFPNTATAETSSDIVSSGAEPQKDILDQVADKVKDIIPSIAPAAAKFLVIGGLLAGGYFLLKDGVSDGIRRIRKRRSTGA